MAEGGAALGVFVAYKSLPVRISGALLMSTVHQRVLVAPPVGVYLATLQPCNLATPQEREQWSQCVGSLRGGSRRSKNEEWDCLADDVTDLDRTEVAAVVAAARRTEEENFAGIETPASAPREQWSAQSISDGHQDGPTAVDPQRKAQATNSIAGDCNHRLHEQEGPRQITARISERAMLRW